MRRVVRYFQNLLKVPNQEKRLPYGRARARGRLRAPCGPHRPAGGRPYRPASPLPDVQTAAASLRPPARRRPGTGLRPGATDATYGCTAIRVSPRRNLPGVGTVTSARETVAGGRRTRGRVERAVAGPVGRGRAPGASRPAVAALRRGRERKDPTRRRAAHVEPRPRVAPVAARVDPLVRQPGDQQPTHGE